VVVVVSVAEEFSDALVTSIPANAVSTIVAGLAFGYFDSVDLHRHPDFCFGLCSLSCGGFYSSWSFAIC
jgi:hypothetical protein